MTDIRDQWAVGPRKDVHHERRGEEVARTDLVAQALTNAVATRTPTALVIFHTDRGCQYASSQYARLADQLGVRLSVGRRGQCWDNAVGESFFATIKTELLDQRAWPIRARAQQAIFEWIEG